MQSSKLVVVLLLSVAGSLQAQSLREEADKAGILIGTAVNPVYLSEPAYASTLIREFNMVEPEDAMKWHVIRRDDRSFNFAPADRIVEFAELHHMKVRGHTLVWASHNPKWLEESNLTQKQLSDLLHDHINQVVGRYKGKVFAWDVVNEAFEEHGELRHSIWYNKPGIGAGKKTGYIAQAFRWAHDADPQALLFYNDAEAEEVNRKSNAIYRMVKRFKQRGVPIHGVGMQMHIFRPNPNLKSIAANIQRFTQLGVQVHITEMDVALPVDEKGNPLEASDLGRQAEIYRGDSQDVYAKSRLHGLSDLGLYGQIFWIPRETHKTKGAALLFDRDYQPKPAYDVVRHVLTKWPRTSLD